MTVRLEIEDGSDIEEEVSFGEIKLIHLAEGHDAKAVITPGKDFDLGNGLGRPVEKTVMGGVAGVLLDARGRPLQLAEEKGARKDQLLSWFKDLDLYPEDGLKELI